jgi:hypothetical protein
VADHAGGAAGAADADESGGAPLYADNAWLTGSSELVGPAIRCAFAELPTPESFSIWFSMAPLRELPGESEDEHCRAWLAGQMAPIEPVSARQYLGDSDFATRQAKFMAAPRLSKNRTKRAPGGC